MATSSVYRLVGWDRITTLALAVTFPVKYSGMTSPHLQYNNRYTVKPVLETTCIKRPPGVRDHSLLPLSGL